MEEMQNELAQTQHSKPIVGSHVGLLWVRCLDQEVETSQEHESNAGVEKRLSEECLGLQHQEDVHWEASRDENANQCSSLEKSETGGVDIKDKDDHSSHEEQHVGDGGAHVDTEEVTREVLWLGDYVDDVEQKETEHQSDHSESRERRIDRVSAFYLHSNQHRDHRQHQDQEHKQSQVKATMTAIHLS